MPQICLKIAAIFPDPLFTVDAADSAPGIDLNEDHRSVFGDGDWYIINRSVERLFE